MRHSAAPAAPTRLTRERSAPSRSRCSRACKRTPTPGSASTQFLSTPEASLPNSTRFRHVPHRERASSHFPQILESLIKFRWKILPREQCQAIKGYIVGLVIKLSQTDELLQREKLVLAKLNDVLVQVRVQWSSSLTPHAVR